MNFNSIVYYSKMLQNLNFEFQDFKCILMIKHLYFNLSKMLNTRVFIVFIHWYFYSYSSKKSEYFFHLCFHTNTLHHMCYLNPGCPTLDCQYVTPDFQGCVRLIFINSQPIYLNHVQQGLLGNYNELQFDTCNIRDR